MIEIIESHWPCVKVQISETVDLKEMNAYLKDLYKLVKRKEDFTLLLDFSEVDSIEDKARNKQMQWIQDKEKELKKHCLGLAMVIPKLTRRAATQAYLAINPLPVQTSVVGKVAAAEKWCSKLIG